jgi:hypothetical protein
MHSYYNSMMYVLSFKSVNYLFIWYKILLYIKYRKTNEYQLCCLYCVSITMYYMCGSLHASVCTTNWEVTRKRCYLHFPIFLRNDDLTFSMKKLNIWRSPIFMYFDREMYCFIKINSNVKFMKLLKCFAHSRHFCQTAPFTFLWVYYILLSILWRCQVFICSHLQC